MLKKLLVTLLVIRHSIVPSAAAEYPPGGPAEALGGDVPLLPPHIGWCLANLSMMVRTDGTIKLLFRHCTFPAAPFVLFRLKREGYSRCRATTTDEGLLVEAVR